MLKVFWQLCLVVQYRQHHWLTSLCVEAACCFLCVLHKFHGEDFRERWVLSVFFFLLSYQGNKFKDGRLRNWNDKVRLWHRQCGYSIVLKVVWLSLTKEMTEERCSSSVFLPAHCSTANLASLTHSNLPVTTPFSTARQLEPIHTFTSTCL